jgi:hypothetical protein
MAAAHACLIVIGKGYDVTRSSAQARWMNASRDDWQVIELSHRIAHG